MQPSEPVVDLNCDLGESFGVYRLGEDGAVMPGITSANVACGFHAGDPSVISRTVDLALAHGVAVGAHPGLPDLLGFGRRAMAMAPEEIEAAVLYQIGALYAFVRAQGAELTHVKAHGALYNMAASDRAVALAVARAVRRFDPSLILVGLAGSLAVEVAVAEGLTVAREAFADREYNPDGSLRSRQLAGAVIDDPSWVIARALRLVRDGVVEAYGGSVIPVRADTICLHGDTPRAAQLAGALRTALTDLGVAVKPLRSFLSSPMRRDV